MKEKIESIFVENYGDIFFAIVSQEKNNYSRNYMKTQE
jgi:hypothetical protein